MSDQEKEVETNAPNKKKEVGFRKRHMRGNRSHGRKKGKETPVSTDADLGVQIEDHGSDEKSEEIGEDETVIEGETSNENEKRKKNTDHSDHSDHDDSHSQTSHSHSHSHSHSEGPQEASDAPTDEGPQPQEEIESAVRRRKRKEPKENPLMATTKRLKDLARKKDEERNAAQIKSGRSAIPTVGVDVGVTVAVPIVKRANPNKPKWIGPMKESVNVRTISRFDYQPDLCKDYKETGYCGYGDSCKFLHDRGDYKTGWQLEREWEEEQRKRKKKFLGEEVDEEENYEIKNEDDPDKDLPFACLICRYDFTKPVQTKCGHYYCEKCALNHYTKDSRCFVCNQQTNGIFNTAHRLLNAIATRKKRLAEEQERAAFQTKPHNAEAAGWAYPKGPEAV